MINCIVAGQPQSGSTFVYNAVLFILHKISDEVFASTVDSAWLDNKSPYKVGKVHAFSDVLATQSIIFTTKRNPIDCAVSNMKRMQATGFEIGSWTPYYYLCFNMKCYKKWASFARSEFSFHDIIKNPAGVYYDLCRTFSLENVSYDTFDAHLKYLIDVAPDVDDSKNSNFGTHLISKSHITSSSESELLSKGKLYFSPDEYNILRWCITPFTTAYAFNEVEALIHPPENVSLQPHHFLCRSTAHLLAGEITEARKYLDMAVAVEEELNYFSKFSKSLYADILNARSGIDESIFRL